MGQANVVCNRENGGSDIDERTQPKDRDIGGHSHSFSLPDDIILEVLLRLPAKSLRRFSCVCKSWHALISDPSFIDAQRFHATTGPLIVAMFGSAPRQELRLLDKGGNVLKVFDDVTLGGSTRALLAPTCLDDLIFVDRGRHSATVIDPASGHDFTIIGGGAKDPWPPNNLWVPTSMPTSTMVSDYSFGRAAVSGDYKVLCLVTWSQGMFVSRRCCEVATIVMDGGDGAAEPTCWRRGPWGPFFDVTFSSEDKATVRSVLYFMPRHTKYRARSRIAAFDLESEKWKPKMIKCPPLKHKKNDASHVALTELKGTLCVVHNKGNLASGHHYINIWLLMDAKKSAWVKEYRIQMPASFLLSIMPLDILDNGTRLLLLTGSLKAGNDYYRYMLEFYNSSTKDFTEFMEMEQGFNGRMTVYTGSLIKSCM